MHSEVGAICFFRNTARSIPPIHFETGANRLLEPIRQQHPRRPPNRVFEFREGR